MDRPGMKKVGSTTGLVTTCDRATFKAEQVYVNRTTVPSTHPVEIQGWVGYDVPSKLRLTKRQATELIGLLAEAIS